MDINKELEIIQKILNSMGEKEFNNMLIRNGYGNEIYKRPDDIIMGVDLEEQK